MSWSSSLVSRSKHTEREVWEDAVGVEGAVGVVAGSRRDVGGKLSGFRHGRVGRGVRWDEIYGGGSGRAREMFEAC